jgi:hypothetical protein
MACVACDSLRQADRKRHLVPDSDSVFGSWDRKPSTRMRRDLQNWSSQHFSIVSRQ